MGVFSWLWIAWAAMFVAVEATAIVRGDRPSAPRTLSANVWWLVRGAGVWHHVARGLLAVGLAWLVPHLLS